jgi:hypothetical protein
VANVQKLGGLVPVQYLNGAPWTAGGRMYCIPDSDDSNAYAIGDPVAYAGSSDSNGVATITLATAGTGNTVLGSIVATNAQSYGGQYGVPADSPIVIPAAKTRNYYVLVCDDPNVIFQIKEENSGSALAATEVGLNANLVAGANNGYVSGWMIDRTSPAVTATLQLRLLGLAQISNNAFGDDAQWWVLINNHSYRIGQVGI